MISDRHAHVHVGRQGHLGGRVLAGRHHLHREEAQPAPGPHRVSGESSTLNLCSAGQINLSKGCVIEVFLGQQS